MRTSTDPSGSKSSQLMADPRIRDSRVGRSCDH